MRIPFKFKIIIGFLGVELFFLSMIILYNYNSIQKFTKEIVNNDIKTNEVLIKEMVKTPVMIYDLATLDDMLNKFASLQNIIKVQVYDANKKLLSSYENKNINIYAIEYRENYFDLKNDNMTIGYVNISFNLQNVREKINENTSSIIMIAIFEIIVSIFISFIIGRKLSKHLLILDDAVKNFNSTSLNPLSINSHDEFEDIADSFNSMQLRLKDEIEKNKEKNNRLIEQSKLASMGEMIGNIAHQWRQPLSVISTGVTGLKLKSQMDILEKKELIETCELVNDNAQYLSKTIDDFRNFIKNDREEILFNLSEDINSFLHLVEGSAKNNNIEVVLDLDNNINIYGYPNELIQCFLNIFGNSKDALKKKDGFRMIKISSFIQDNHVHIDFVDNAGGIKTDVLPHVFEPYFTTKHKEKGTGLGLSMTYNLIKKGMKGNITATNISFKYNNEEQNGALFKIVLKST